MIITSIYVMPKNTSKSTYHTCKNLKVAPREGEIIELHNDDAVEKPYRVTEVSHTPDENSHDIAITVKEI